MNSLKKYYAEATSVFVFIIYLFTLAPSVVQIDAGELAAVQSTLGIAHPTGYPLFTMIGYLFLKIPLPITKIMQANLLAAIWCALGIYFFIKILQLVFSLLPVQPEKQKKAKEKIPLPLTQDQKIITIISSALFLALSKTYWMQSTSVEVYSMQIFFFMLIIFVSLKTCLKEKKNIFDWLPVGIAYAFGFANHMTTMLVIPFSAILFFQKERFEKKSFIIIAVTTLLSIPLLVLFYAYLPIRASMNPAINWGNPINMENILRHVSGKQYQVWMFASMEAARKQFRYFLSDLPSEFAYAGLLLGIIGFLFLIKQNKKLLIALATTFAFTVLYSINYDIVDIDSYFLLAYIIFGIFISFGLAKLLLYFKEKSIKDVYSFAIVGILCFFPLVLNSAEVNSTGVYAYDDYTKAILSSTEKNSIIFSYQWDYSVSPSYYFQNVEGFRKDVTVIDKELLRRSWYYNQLKTNHPDVISKVEKEYRSFLETLRPFERDEKFIPDSIEKNYRALMTNLIANNIADRNYYITLELMQTEMQSGTFSLPKGYQLVPYLLSFKVTNSSEYMPAPDPNFTIRLPKEKNKYIQFIENTVGTMLTYRAAYELQFDKKERARVYLDKVINEFKNFQIPQNILRAAEY